MAKILIVYSSQTGHTERMAAAVADGARAVEGTETLLKRAPEADLSDLLAADGIAFGTPENFGTMAGLLKDFFDRTYAGAEGKTFRKPYALFVSAGNDGTGAVRAVERIALGFKFRKVYEAVICRGEVTEETLEKCRELGGVLAAGCGMGIY